MIINPEIYRGFYVYPTEGQLNAKPTPETADAHPGFVPVAARTREELLAVLDYQIDETDY